MSAPYTLHLPHDAEPGDPRALDRAVLVRDGFSVWAFLAPALWFLVHRHWVPALVAVAVVASVPPLLALLGVSAGAIVAVEILVHLLFGLEGSSLRRLDLAWRGRPARDVVMASNKGEAETRAFARWLDGAVAPAPVLPAAASAARYPLAPAAGSPAIIGLFPDRERGR